MLNDLVVLESPVKVVFTWVKQRGFKYTTTQRKSEYRILSEKYETSQQNGSPNIIEDLVRRVEFWKKRLQEVVPPQNAGLETG